MPDYAPYEEEGIAPGYGTAVAFDEPDQFGARYPIATPRGGSWTPHYTPPSVTPEFSPNGGRYLPGSESIQALPGGGYNQAYAADELRSQQAEDPQSIQQSVRLRGLLKYQQMIRDGANPAEAIRIAAPELYFNHPMASVSAMRGSESAEIPTISEIPLSQGKAVFVNGRYRTTLRPPSQTPSLAVKNDITEAGEDVTQAMRNLSLAQRGIDGKGLMVDDKLVKQREQELKDARERRRAIVRQIESPKALTLPPAESKKLTKEIAADLLKQAKGDKNLARRLARDAGYEF